MALASCCFKGLFSHFTSGEDPFSEDVVAQIKRNQSRSKPGLHSKYSSSSSDSLDDLQNKRNSSSRQSENNKRLSALSNAKSPSMSSLSTRGGSTIALSSVEDSTLNESNKNGNDSTSLQHSSTSDILTSTGAKSFDESDSESSSDSDEETLRNIKKAMYVSSGSLPKQQSSFQSLPGTSQDAGTSKLSHEASSSLSSAEHKLSSESLETVNERRKNQLRSGQKEDQGWTLGETDSISSKEASSAIEDDEVAAAIAVKPPLSSKDEDDDYPDQPLISSCGTLDIGLQYSLTNKKLQITIIEAKDLPAKERGGASVIQVHAVVLPAKRKRYKTKVQHINSLRFSETFKLSHITPEELKGLGLRLRLYGIGKVRDRLIGEAAVRFDELDLIKDPHLTVTLQLEPRTDVNRGDLDLSAAASSESDVSTLETLAHGGSLPELLLSMSYDEITGRLGVEVVKGSHFRNMAMTKPPDTFVKLVLLNSDYQEMAQSKTTIRRSQPNPVFKETFFFQVALFQLTEVSLMASVYCNYTIKKKSMLGWISMGRNSSSDEDAQHWQEMIDAKGKFINRWHTLVNS